MKSAAWAGRHSNWPPLSEDEVGDVGLEVPIDDRVRGEIERCVRTHQHPDLTCQREDRTKHESGDRSLFGACEPLLVVVARRVVYAPALRFFHSYGRSLPSWPVGLLVDPRHDGGSQGSME